MAINLPGPYEADYAYIVSGITHHLRVNCMVMDNPAPGTPFTDLEVQTRSGTPVLLSGAVQTLWDWIRPFMAGSVAAPTLTLWKYVTGTFEKDFISASSGITGAGSNAGAFNPAHYRQFSFRSANGGIMKVSLMEDSDTDNTITNLVANAAGNASQKLAAYVISTDGWLLARDDSFPIAPYHENQGQNEAIFRRRFRQL